MNSVVVWLLISFTPVNGGSSQLLVARTPTAKACNEAKDAFIAGAKSSGARVFDPGVFCSKAEVIVEGNYNAGGGSAFTRKENQ
jgi:hypothetical protein